MNIEIILKCPYDGNDGITRIGKTVALQLVGQAIDIQEGGRQDGKVIVGCCIKQGHDEITKKVREILKRSGTALSLTNAELVDAAWSGEYTFSCLGDATRILSLI